MLELRPFLKQHSFVQQQLFNYKIQEGFRRFLTSCMIYEYILFKKLNFLVLSILHHACDDNNILTMSG